MKKLCCWLVMCCLAACIVKRSPRLQDKFIVAKAEGLNILIKKIDKPEWEIRYSFVADCPEAFKQRENELKELITKSLQIWLQPLRELRPAKKITNDFRFVRRPDVAECYDNEESKKQFDAYVVFSCEVNSAMAWLGGRSPYVCISRGAIINEGTAYDLAHELGHAFGLLDTYVRKVNPSTGGLRRTAGKQPSSIMASLSFVEPPRVHPYLKEDDKNGIIWLYKYFHEDHPEGDCFFPDHVLVPDEGRGICEPRYPLIFEAKHGAFITVRDILNQDPDLDINASDVGGNTALHYAVKKNNTRMVTVLLAQPSIKVNITNKNGHTPAKLARQLNLLNLAQLIEAHPSAKQAPMAVTPKGKKPVIWGELKRNTR